jgi:hypothetical protein
MTPQVTLTLAQAKAGLIAAAKCGLIDGSELNESWFQTLRRDVYNATKKSKSSNKKDTKKGTDKSAKETKSQPSKKISAVVTGFMKFNHTVSKLGFDEEIKTVDQLKETLTSEKMSPLIKAIAVRNSYVNAEGKSQIKSEDYAELYQTFGLGESEAKAARTWFPYFFSKIPNEKGSGN